MKALLLQGSKHLELTDVPDPSCGTRDLLVRVEACGICGSDIHGYDGSTRRRQPPIIMGHEAAGVVVEAGEQTSQFSPGDRITFDSTISCGACYFCRQGKVNLCEDRRVLGVACDEYRQHGAFAQLVAVPESICYRLPDDLEMPHAALIEAVSIAVHAVGRTPLQLGDSAVVIGTGMIGLLVVQALRLAGCSSIIAIDQNDQRLELAQQLGANVGINSTQSDVASRIAKLTGNRGADAVFEVVGIESTLQLAIRCRSEGRERDVDRESDSLRIATITGGRDPRTYPVRIMRVGRSVPGLHRANRTRSNRSRALDHRGRSTRHRPRMV